MRRTGWIKSGFTLIEVVLVLAIAGLLTTVVFLAVSGAQRARRDDQRKRDAVTLVAAVENWRSNNKGRNVQSEADLEEIATKYFNRQDPLLGEPYTVMIVSDGTEHEFAKNWFDYPGHSLPDHSFLLYFMSHICGSDAGTFTYVTNDDTTHRPREYSVLVQLEAGEVYCVDNK